MENEIEDGFETVVKSGNGTYHHGMESAAPN
jgi:hypothetical protein